MSYPTPQALRTAIKVKARAVARTTSRGVSDVMHHYALSRLLARVFRADPDRWVLKGGQAMLVRYPDARHSRDVDLIYSDHDPDYAEALAALRSAAQFDAGDQMKFEYAGCTEVADHRSGITVTFKAVIGATEFAHVSVDLVVDHQPIGRPVTVPLKPVLELKGIDDWPEVRLYPIVDHVADKICAMLERHPGSAGGVSHRFRDLVDLILIIANEQIDGAELHGVLRAEAGRRRQRGTDIELPPWFTVPDRLIWERGYVKQAGGVPNFEEFRTLKAAEALAARFVDPLLANQLPGTWDPSTRSWR